MSCVCCKSCGVWVDSDDTIDGAWDKDKPFGWKCENCLADDGEKADEQGYRVPDPEATIDAQCVKGAFYLMEAINGREGSPEGKAALKEILQAAAERQKQP